MNQVAALHEGELVGAPPLLPEGEYQVTYLSHQIAYSFKRPKVFVHFRIYGGEYDGLKLYRCYRVAAIKGKRRKGGRFTLRHSHELYRQLVQISGRKDRPDRVSLKWLKGCVIRVSIRTVRHNYKQHRLPENLQYSVVDEMRAVDVGST